MGGRRRSEGGGYEEPPADDLWPRVKKREAETVVTEGAQRRPGTRVSVWCPWLYLVKGRRSSLMERRVVSHVTSDLC